MINVLARITQLRESRQWSMYELAKRSSVSQSTISSLYQNGHLPSLITLEAICNAFDMPMEQLMSPGLDMLNLTVGQKKWLAMYDPVRKEKRCAG